MAEERNQEEKGCHGNRFSPWPLANRGPSSHKKFDSNDSWPGGDDLETGGQARTGERVFGYSTGSCALRVTCDAEHTLYTKVRSRRSWLVLRGYSSPIHRSIRARFSQSGPNHQEGRSIFPSQPVTTGAQPTRHLGQERPSRLCVSLLHSGEPNGH